ncbi:hypothetical protein GXW71_01540 [Roseomonas hellenica]|uniref:Uncharacterized protein n=1 Tax=Plastoroseomonas hellenica TaxID=2687306 RepID=A0ABS5ERV5_9PROT|nr:hypothetical protein [Plastoroseomonas hellenica]MBR0663026.1 hypothetical protein [Plastoroseomonas hellenica]
MILLLLIACATGNGPDLPDATASQREISTLPGTTGMQGPAWRASASRHLAWTNDMTGLTDA